jgi:hypothetical protein
LTKSLHRRDGRATDISWYRWRLDQAGEAYRLFDAQTSGKDVILPS